MGVVVHKHIQTTQNETLRASKHISIFAKKAPAAPAELVRGNPVLPDIMRLCAELYLALPQFVEVFVVS